MSSKLKIFLIVLLMFSTAVSASSEGSEEHGFDWSAFWGKVLNSTLLFGGLIILLRKPMIKFLSQKSLEINNDIVQREESVKSAAARFEEIQKRLSHLEAEIENIKTQARETGQGELERLEETGRNEALKIVQAGETEINNRVESAVKRMKARIAELAIDQFKKDIQSRLDDQAHQKIIEKNIEISGDIIERH